MVSIKKDPGFIGFENNQNPKKTPPPNIFKKYIPLTGKKLGFL